MMFLSNLLTRLKLAEESTSTLPDFSSGDKFPQQRNAQTHPNYKLFFKKWSLKDL